MENGEIILAGFGGQGILFAGKILAHAAMLKNKQLSWLPSYGPEMRGGTANCHVIISDEPVGSPIIVEPDVLVAMNRPSLDKFEDSVSSGGIIFTDASLVDRRLRRSDVKAVYVEATKIADAQGKKVLANMVMLGALIKETGLFTIEEIKRTITAAVPPKRAALAGANMEAFMSGYDLNN